MGKKKILKRMMETNAETIMRRQNDMNRDIVWLIIVIMLGGNNLVMLNSENATDPNLIHIEELTQHVRLVRY